MDEKFYNRFIRCNNVQRIQFSIGNAKWSFDTDESVKTDIGAESIASKTLSWLVALAA